MQSKKLIQTSKLNAWRFFICDFFAVKVLRQAGTALYFASPKR